MQSSALAMRGSKATTACERIGRPMAGGGAMSMCAYFIVIWAMAPIAPLARAVGTVGWTKVLEPQNTNNPEAR